VWKLFCKMIFRIPLVWRILLAFVLGIGLGLLCSNLSPATKENIITYSSPFGTVLIAILKMVVFPVIFFSLIFGSSQMPLKKSGKIGGAVIGWYFLTSAIATVFGVLIAILINPSLAEGGGMAVQYADQTVSLERPSTGESVIAFVNGLFQNPFAALASGSFLPVIVYAILFGLAARCILDSTESHQQEFQAVQTMLHLCRGAAVISFKMIDWAMEYFPIGVFALTFSNFTRDGILLFGPYLQIVVVVCAGVFFMLFAIYPLAVFLGCRENPYRFLWQVRQPVLTAFATRSSAAALPVSLKTAEKIGISQSLYCFSLPLGCTINMDGVCIHLPVFVILAGNMFGIDFTFSQLILLVVSVVFASVGAGGIPGGSVFLLFMVLENMGLTPDQVGTVVALALGINPLLDMFETACNVTGDNVCTYIIARRNGLIS